MFISKMLSSYTNIPNGIINCIGPFYNMIPPKMRYGKTFYDTREMLKTYENLDGNKMQELQNELLKKVIIHAYEHVPYYHHIFDEYAINPKQIQSVDDMKVIPFLTKELLKNYKEELIADDIDRGKLQWVTTSGSTGNAVGFYIDGNMPMKDWAWGTYLYKRVGWKDNCSKLMLRGKTFYNKTRGKSWQYDSFKRELSVDIFQMDKEHLELYCRAIEKYKPDNVFGYMSAILALCKYIEYRGGINHQFVGVYACSEMILEEHREYVEKILNVRVFSNYGLSEKVILAGECEFSQEYHIEPLYGVTEIVGNDGNNIYNNNIGELVGTGFNSFGMPLIRYKTGDMASWSEEKECSCGRCHKRISKIEGRRKNDYLIGKDGTKISLTAINMHSNVFDKFLRYQFEQNEKGKVIFRYMEKGDVQKEDIDILRKEIYTKFRENMDVSLVNSDDIKIESSGKFKIINQQIRN